MSWRILIKPASLDDTPDAAADWIIPLNATEDEVDEVADKAAWNCRPLKIFTPDWEDPRLQRLVRQFTDVHGMSEDDYTVYVKKPKEESK